MHLQCLDCRAGDLLLQHEHVVHLTVVALRPEVEAIACVNQLHGDAEPVARLSYAAFENCLHVELLADAPNVLRQPLELKGRCPRGHPQAGQGPQRVDQFVGDTLAQIVLVLLGTHVGKGQHGDRRPVPIGGRGRHTAALCPPRHRLEISEQRVSRRESTGWVLAQRVADDAP